VGLQLPLLTSLQLQRGLRGILLPGRCQQQMLRWWWHAVLHSRYVGMLSCTPGIAARTCGNVLQVTSQFMPHQMSQHSL
jgi:hypothetical protein